MLKRIKHPKTIESKTNLAKRSRALADSYLPSKAQISLLMAELGRKGGRIGGKQRLKTMTAAERTAVAKKAALARWKDN